MTVRRKSECGDCRRSSSRVECRASRRLLAGLVKAPPSTLNAERSTLNLPYNPPLHAARRNRRAAQRRQVHPLQRPHADAKGRGGELSLLHDRAQRRRRGRARRAPGAAREDLEVRARSFPPRSSSWTSPASSGALRRARAWATSSCSTSARSTRSWRSCAASRTRTSSTSPGHLDPIADIETIKTELVLADLETMTRAKDKFEKLARGGDKEAKESLAVAAKLLPHLDAGKRALSLPLSAEEAAIARRFFLLTMQADALRLQRGRGRARDRGGVLAPRGRRQAVRRDARGHRGRRRFRGHRGRARRASRGRGEGVPLPPRRGGLGRVQSHPRRVPPARPAHLPDRRREGSPRLDDPRRRHRARRPPASSTPTSSAGSSRRRPSSTTTCSPPAPWPPRRRRASSARKARTTSSRTATSYSSSSMSELFRRAIVRPPAPRTSRTA